MTEKEKRMPNSSFLTPDDAASFLYELPTSMETVKQVLANLDTTEGPLKHAVTLTPSSEGYTFRYEIVRPAGLGGGVSAYAQGHLSENAQGQAILEGTINIAMSDNQFLLLCGVSVIILPLLLLLIPALLILATQRSDTRRIRDNIAQAMKNAEAHSSVSATPIGFQA